MASRILLFVGLLGLFYCCSAEVSPYAICPASERIAPCKCEQDCDVCIAFIACDNITTMQTLYEVMNKSKDFPFRAASFHNSVFEYIPSVIFEKKQYRMLHVKNSVFSSMLDKPVEGDPPLWDLKLDNVKVQRGASFEFFDVFKRLRFLELKNIPLRKITRKMMNNIHTSLEGLTIDNTSIERIDSEAFSRFTKLSNIYITNGKLKKVEASMFPSSLGQLILSHNKIQTIPADFAKHLTRVFNLYLDHNEITTIDQAAFGSAPKSIGYINLSDNPIECQCDVSWITEIKKPVFMGECIDKKKKFVDLVREDFNYC